MKLENAEENVNMVISKEETPLSYPRNQPALIENKKPESIDDVVQLLHQYAGVQPVVAREKENPPVKLEGKSAVYILYLKPDKVMEKL